MSLLSDFRNREPRLKPGVTYTRLVIFLIGVAVFGVVGEHVVSGREPTSLTSDCRAKGISSELHREGSCTAGETKLVVVNRHSVLKLDSLEAKVEGISERKRTVGPLGPRTAGGAYVVFDLALTNLTGSPQTFTADQALLELGRGYVEDATIDRDYERRSFLARGRDIPPHGTEVGTVTFEVPRKQVEVLKKHGNLDLGNFGAATAGGGFEPEAIFGGSEYGVIRTYQ